MPKFRFTVDEAHVKAHNEYYRDSRRLRTSAAIMAAAAIALAVACVWLWSGVWAWIIFALIIAFALSCLYVLFTLPKQIGSPQELYDRWPLVPAVIAEVNPRDMTLLALVDVNAAEAADPQPALATRTVTRIPGVPRRVGARVPSVAVCGAHTSGGQVWDEITPVPVAWGTPDKKAVTRAEDAIEKGQWLKLQGLIDRAAQVRGTRRGLLPLEG